MRVRRIFRPSLATRLAPYAAGGTAMCVVVLLAVGVPRELFGSAPREAPLQAAAADVRVVDGGTLRLGERIVRLQALEVPERGRAICRDSSGREQDCGAASAEAMARLVADRDLTCRIQGHDRQGRAIGLCSAAGTELAASQVAAGWALVDRGGQPALAAIEATARAARRGLWAAATPPPESWRRGF
jgi:endonuclease YncB( thermonuclease family)